MDAAQKPSDEQLEALRKAVLERASRMEEADLRRLFSHEAAAAQTVKRLQGKLPRFARHVQVGFSMVRDYWKGEYRDAPWWSVASVAAGLFYFIAPTDLWPDFVPLVGYIDDAAVLAAVMQSIRKDLVAYCEFKGMALDE